MTLVTVAPLRADLADDYLAGLRERGWHDTALEYLDEAAADPIATAQFRQKIGYERATTQAALARGAVGEKKRQAQLVGAAESFARFAAERPDSPLQLQALATAGNLFSELALYANNKAEKLPLAARSQRKQLQGSSRGYLDRAEVPLQTLLDQSEAKLQSLPKAAVAQKNSGTQLGRQQLEAKQAQAKFLLAKLDFERSRTYAPDSKAYGQSLQAAAAAFAKLYDDYEDKLVGFYGRFYEGRSYQAAGDRKQALECYWDIVDEPPIPNQDFRRLVARTYRYRAECHLAEDEFESAIKECREWLDESRGDELTEPDWLAVSYQLARAYEAKAVDPDGNDGQKLRNQARKLYREIARVPGEYQRDAKAQIASSSTGHDQPVDVDTFDEAFAAGKDAVAQMNSAKLAARLAAENNPASVESLATQADSHRIAAGQYFRQAAQLADDETDRDELVTARYYLCWLYWEDGRLADAAVIGEFLARRYPESKYAPVAAKLALAAYERLYNEAKQAGDSTDFESQQLAEVAELLALRWPESPEAAAGINLMINMALSDDRLSDAERLLERLPPARRAGAELRLGGSLWTRYVRASGSLHSTTGDDALALMDKAGEFLASGFQGLQAKPQVSASEAAGVLYYAQFLLAKGDATQAVAALEHPAIGPLSLIDNGSPAASRPEFVQETYIVALRSYVSLTPPQRGRAQQMMAALESAIGGQDKGQQKLINLYFNLGRQLQQQISALTTAGQSDKASAVATSFEDLLTRVTERVGAAEDWKVQSWIAETNLQLGQGLSGDDATRYYQQAEAAFESLLAKTEQNPKFAPSARAVLATKKRLADCRQAQDDHVGAFKLYTSLLQEKPSMLELQLAAATALQRWGIAEGDARRLDESIRGALPQANKRNLVWGWLRSAAIVDRARRDAEKRAASEADQAAKAAKYQELFFETRYNAAQARFDAAKLRTGAQRQKQLGTARQSLESMRRLYPKLGGPKWKNAYLHLLKQIEQELLEQTEQEQ